MSGDLMEPSEVAKALGVSTERVRQLAMTGVLFPAAKRGQTRLYSAENVAAVAAARKAGDEVRNAAAERGVEAGDIPERIERSEMQRIIRENMRRANQRAHGRLEAMQRRLDAINQDRIPVAAELAAIDAERAYLVGAIERLAADLAVLSGEDESTAAARGPESPEEWVQVINLHLNDGHAPEYVMEFLVADSPDQADNIRAGFELVPDVWQEQQEQRARAESLWRERIGLPPRDMDAPDAPLVLDPPARPMLRRPGGRITHRRESRASGDDPDPEAVVRAFLDAIERWEAGE